MGPVGDGRAQVFSGRLQERRILMSCGMAHVARCFRLCIAVDLGVSMRKSATLRAGDSSWGNGGSVNRESGGEA